MKRILLACILFFAAPAFAQQPSLTDLQMQRNEFMRAFAQCDSATITLQQQFSEMQRKLAEAEAKLKAADQGQAKPK